MLALVAVAVAGMAFVLADTGPATAVLTPTEIEAAKAVNRHYPVPAESAASFAPSAGKADFEIEPSGDEPATGVATEPGETSRRRRATSQRERVQARREEPKSREWTAKFFER